MMGLQMGFSRMKFDICIFGEWSDLFDEYKRIYNFKIKKMLFRTKEERFPCWICKKSLLLTERNDILYTKELMGEMMKR